MKSLKDTINENLIKDLFKKNKSAGNVKFGWYNPDIDEKIIDELKKYYNFNAANKMYSNTDIPTEKWIKMYEKGKLEQIPFPEAVWIVNKYLPEVENNNNTIIFQGAAYSLVDDDGKLSLIDLEEKVDDVIATELL